MKSRRFMALLLALMFSMSMFALPGAALAEAKLNAKDYTSKKAAFKVGVTTYRIGTTSKTWKKKLGNYTRKQSDGDSEEYAYYIYNFSNRNVRVETLCNLETNKETVVGVLITGRTVGTSDGLKVGNTFKKMIRIYGEGYKKSGSSTYTYTAGGNSMAVKIQNNKVKSITLMKL